MIHDKPFYSDEPPRSFQEAADISVAAMKLWQYMQQVTQLVEKLYGHTGLRGEAVIMAFKPSVIHTTCQEQ